MKTPRQNVLDLFHRRGIERSELFFSLCPAMVDKFERKFGHRDYVEEFDFAIRSAEIPLLKQDFSDWKGRFFAGIDFLPGTTFDIWGVAHESTPESMHMSRMYQPMRDFSTLAEYEAYPYPEFDPSRLGELRGTIEDLHRRGYFVSQLMQCTVWENAWYMRGMEAMMVDMLSGDETAAYHLDRVTDLACRMAEAYAAAGADLIFLGDDIGMQQTIMMSRELYCEWLKPRLAKVVAAARAVRPDILISYHSCGFVEPFIDDLIEAGIDILNPVQPECMDFAKLHAEYGDRLSFWGTLGTQTLFPHGTPEEVYDETLRNLRLAGPKGGLLPTPTHLVEPEVPLENILAYVQACRDFKPSGYLCKLNIPAHFERCPSVSCTGAGRRYSRLASGILNHRRKIAPPSRSPGGIVKIRKKIRFAIDMWGFFCYNIIQVKYTTLHFLYN